VSKSSRLARVPTFPSARQRHGHRRPRRRYLSPGYYLYRVGQIAYVVSTESCPRPPSMFPRCWPSPSRLPNVCFAPPFLDSTRPPHSLNSADSRPCPVYDVSSRSTFDELVKWFREIETYCGEGVVKMVVGNKVDKASEQGIWFISIRRASIGRHTVR
jgi:hypothetical protein